MTPLSDFGGADELEAGAEDVVGVIELLTGAGAEVVVASSAGADDDALVEATGAGKLTWLIGATGAWCSLPGTLL